MTPTEHQGPEAEFLAEQAAAQAAQAVQLSAVAGPKQDKESAAGEVVGDIVEEVLDTATDPDLLDLAANGLSAAASGVADLAAGAVDLAGSVVGSAAEVAGHVVSGAVEVVGEVIGGLLS
ncbi:hypothetical protein WJ97_13140 [Burkholderia ubonensis]|uniref:hypothetical protein n=1 Tax=Burkholderia ubonensis TaxID=101571 RepID=UPI0007551BE0|nr:hypothetical protein [Burkholderia ubonensis]KVP96819.1 hypothetical protein WJ97_13140 [Burkholderia ubonensis]